MFHAPLKTEIKGIDKTEMGTTTPSKRHVA